jgi:uncharacterized protein (TIGR00375 family)
LWLKELKTKLNALGNGLFEYDETLYVLSGEVCNIFTVGGKVKKIHNVILAPSFEIVEQINEKLKKSGDLCADGRPTLSMEAAELVEIVMGISEECFIFPAHAWTPHFSVFGANSGFDSVEECYGEKSKHIHALETGLSSDPPINWRLSALDKYTLVSNSDSHSLGRIGREANVFELEKVTYQAITNAIKEKDKSKFKMTIEFFPEEGKYHYDGHRSCNIRMSPSESKKNGNICPVCKKRLTIGVMHRVEQLADRPEGFIPENAIPYIHLIPLDEIIANAMKRGVSSDAVRREYQKLLAYFKSEFNVLLDASYEEISKITYERVASGIMKMRSGKVNIKPGYDGVYGEIELFGGGEESRKGQKKLDEFLA